MSKTLLKSPRRGRPPSEAAHSHALIMAAVYDLLQERPVGELTMEAIARRARVGKPTLYKWWPTKAALIMAMFNERFLDEKPAKSAFKTIEEALRYIMSKLVTDYNGPFGKVMADLIAEGQSDPAMLQDLHNYIEVRRAATADLIEKGMLTGEFSKDIDVESSMDAIFGPTIYRLLLGFKPITKAYGERLITQVMRGMKASESRKLQRRRTRS